MKLTSMAYTKAEEKKRNEGMKIGGESPSGPRYPYGLKLCLEDEVVDKLGLDELPKVGKKMRLTAVVEVCGTSQREEVKGKKRQTLDLQIVKMGLGPNTAEGEAPDRNDPDYIAKMQDRYDEDEDEGEDA